MRTPTQLDFRGIEKSEAIEALVNQKIDWLGQFCGEILSCRVDIDKPHRRHRQGNRFNVHLHLHVPGEDIVATHEPGERRRDEDLYAAIHDAFNIARRQLEEYTRRRRRQIKAHEPRWSLGAVADTFSDDGFGFIRCPDDRRVYFHRNSVERNLFDDLRPGADVCFIEEAGEEGPQAAVVRVLAPRSQRSHLIPTYPRHRYEAAW